MSRPRGFPPLSALPAREALDPQLIEGFQKTFLLSGFDAPRPTPAFHRELWADFCSPYQYVAEAAPRGHAKSTAGTKTFSLAALLFGFRDYELIVSASEATAVSHVQDIRKELVENEALIECFKIHGLSKDNEAEIVGHVGERAFKITAKGAEQKLRGLKWRNRRPNLILVDDLEDDEQVESQDRREKLRRWFFRALLPMGSDDCLIRVVGTILHEDSLLARLIRNKHWTSKLYRAHAAFDDFGRILWPEKFSEAILRGKRDMFVADGEDSSYSQEYLNEPIAPTNIYFAPKGFIPLTTASRRAPKTYYVGIDFAISKAQHADRTAIVVAGLTPENKLCVVDVRADRWDSAEIIEEMFAVQRAYCPDLWFAEAGHIEKTLGPFLNAEMLAQDVWLNIDALVPTQDKVARARSYQGRHKSLGVEYDKDADWWPTYYHEMKTFPRGQHDDRVDASALIGLGLAKLIPAPSEEEEEEAEVAYEELMARLSESRSVTGY